VPVYELWAPDDATLDQAITAIGLQGRVSGKSGSNTFAVDRYGDKYVQNGVVNGAANMVLQSGKFANINWVGPTAIPSIASVPTATIQVQATPYYRRFANI
jgi:hypothetical protein